MNKFVKAVMSCKTLEQLETCQEWSSRIYDYNDKTIFGNYIAELDREKLIKEMREYLLKVNSLSTLSDDKVTL